MFHPSSFPGEAPQRESSRLHQFSETTSSSSSSQGYAANGMAPRRPEALPAPEPYTPAPEPYPMESDKGMLYMTQGK